jgi:hypothetical protein
MIFSLSPFFIPTTIPTVKMLKFPPLLVGMIRNYALLASGIYYQACLSKEVCRLLNSGTVVDLLVGIAYHKAPQWPLLHTVYGELSCQ